MQIKLGAHRKQMSTNCNLQTISAEVLLLISDIKVRILMNQTQCKAKPTPTILEKEINNGNGFPEHLFAQPKMIHFALTLSPAAAFICSNEYK